MSNKNTEETTQTPYYKGLTWDELVAVATVQHERASKQRPSRWQLLVRLGTALLPLLAIGVTAIVIREAQGLGGRFPNGLPSLDHGWTKFVAFAVIVAFSRSLLALRERRRDIYGVVEVTVGYLGVWYGALPLLAKQGSFAWAATVTAIYLLVRGFDNAHAGQKQQKEREQATQAKAVGTSLIGYAEEQDRLIENFKKLREGGEPSQQASDGRAAKLGEAERP